MVLILIPMLSGCKTTPVTPTATEVTAPPTSTLPEPTPTSEPMAARINGEGISLEFFQSELARYQQTLIAMELPLPAEDEMRETVINDLVDQVLLKQGAEAGGYIVSDEDYQSEVNNLINDLGAAEALDAWMAEQGYNAAQFEYAMRLSIAASKQKATIADSVPEAVAQVHARQIFAYTSDGAQRALTSLNSGTDFDEIAWTYDPISGGDLSWFPRGYLTVEVVEVAAFSLGIGEVSPIIESDLGYHIIKVLEIDEAHPLTSDARISLQRNALQEWLKISREQADVVIEY